MEHDELHHTLTTVAGVQVCIGQDEALLVRSLRKLAGNATVHLICDENTLEDCLPLFPLLRACCNEPIVFSPGEQHKQMRTCEMVWKTLIEQGAGRKSIIVNLGGGVVTDLGGFCAAVFQRGIRFVHIPTTLLGMCDAAIGGKQGVDFVGLKNYLGVFAQPELIWIDTRCLSTLSARHIRNGMAEVLKHAIIGAPGLFEVLETLDPERAEFRKSMHQIIAAAIAVKKRFVEQDVHEDGIRAALNFGHTFGHALESLLLRTRKDVLHGECVAAGMILETWLSNLVLGAPDRDDCRRITTCIEGWIPLEIAHHIILDDVIRLMTKDKKSEGGQMRFTLIRGIGQVETGHLVLVEMLHKLIRDPEVAALVPWLKADKD